tara:strand:+ start:336 stop:1004 length:669 start_codon:yes stop_codon:yes gene_type:complete
MRLVYFFIVLFLFQGSVFSTDESLVLSFENESKSEIKPAVHFKKMYKNDLAKLTDLLIIKQFKEAQVVLSKIQEKIFNDFQDQIQICFPNSFQSLKAVQVSKISQGEFEKVDFGVVFTKQYKDKFGRKLEVNIVDAEQSAQDYKDLIENPNLIEGLENSSLISYESFKAIQTVDLNAKHYEQNILLSDTIIMTVVVIGVDDVSYLREFVNEISFDKLKKLID